MIPQTLIFNDRIISLDDISYIERKNVEHKKKTKDSDNILFPSLTYDIIFHLKSSGFIQIWYSTKESRDAKYNELLEFFSGKNKEKLFESFFGKSVL